MTQAEYKEYRSIKASLHSMPPTYGCSCTIRTSASSDYKQRLHDLYRMHGMHPAAIRIDRSMYDDNERIIYIYGITFWSRNWKNDDGRVHLQPWSELYSQEQLERFRQALK